MVMRRASITFADCRAARIFEARRRAPCRTGRLQDPDLSVYTPARVQVLAPLKVPPQAPLNAQLAQVVRRREAHCRNILSNKGDTENALSPSKRSLSGLERLDQHRRNLCDWPTGDYASPASLLKSRFALSDFRGTIMRPSVFAFMVLFLFVVNAFAEPPATLKPVAQDEQELVFLQSSRPYRLRLHLQIQGESFQTQWNRIVEALFQYLDVDGNGVLSAAELEHAPSPEQLRGLIQGSTELEAAGPPEMAEVTD